MLLFEDVEVLDFAGPFEVFSMARATDHTPLFEVCTFSRAGRPLHARHGLAVIPQYGLADLPPLDVLLLPGGPDAGVQRVLDDADFLRWLVAQRPRLELLLSVCTGAWILARAGLLAGRRATTYHSDYERLLQLDSSIIACPGERYADTGDVVTSAGVSAGIDMSLYVVQKLFGAEIARATARRMEYDYFQPL
jgi:transcriptional regulator GlxA family with amidase domain